MNVEEAVLFLYHLSDDDDTTESDGDNPSEDVVDVDENILLLGPKLLAKPPHIELSNRNSRLEPCLSVSSPISLEPQEELADAASHTRKGKKPPRKRTKHTHEWKKHELEQSSGGRQLSEEDHRPKILHKWADEGLTPIDIFKYMWNEEVM